LQEEWVICRVFQKSSAPKKPQQTSSSQPSEDSMVNEFGDADLPNLNSIANSSSVAAQIYNSGDPSNVSTNMNLAMNWPSATELPSLPWPSGLLLNPNLSVNSLLLRALQLRNRNSYQQREAATSDHFATYVPQTFPHNNIGTHNDNLTPNLSVSASSTALELQEQPFNMDSIWWSACVNHVNLACELLCCRWKWFHF